MFIFLKIPIAVKYLIFFSVSCWSWSSNELNNSILVVYRCCFRPSSFIWWWLQPSCFCHVTYHTECIINLSLDHLTTHPFVLSLSWNITRVPLIWSFGQSCFWVIFIFFYTTAFIYVNNFTFSKLSACIPRVSQMVCVSVPKVSYLFYNIQFRSWRQFVSVVNISVILYAYT